MEGLISILRMDSRSLFSGVRQGGETASEVNDNMMFNLKTTKQI